VIQGEYHAGMAGRVAISVRVPAAVAEEIDAARGGQTRTAWVEAAIDAALREAKPAARRKVDPGECPHPRGRVIKGFCYRCGKPAT
jgi:hypothetical protein